MTNKPESLPFSNLAFLTDYYRNIWNEENLCSQEIDSWTIHCNKW